MNANSLDRFIARASAIGLLVMLVMMLASCASVFTDPVPGYGLQWVRVADPLPLKHWIQVDNVKAECRSRYPEIASDWNGTSCIVRLPSHCIVLSAHSEAFARRNMLADGMYEFDHEKRHCDGEDHLINSVWSMTLAHGVVR